MNFLIILILKKLKGSEIERGELETVEERKKWWKVRNPKF